ncbi:radical SAM domain protein [Candidatus Vecturithrix granuli]|uniref:Radical SAM domain protein n=1 Tax=Vecturithrix granuli TaxID=1499967 RepID=A0A081BYC9_VECG1|nr:radical SAM domain protein [Candidatus Vecturithrix granuli]
MDYRIRQDAERKLHRERGTIFKIAHGKIRIALIYPNTYYVGMSNLGLQTIYGFLNERDDVCCERAFLPEPAMLDLYTRTHIPLCSLESQTPLSEFDILAFSVSYENDELNILKILELAQIPLKAAERDHDAPLVLLGGALTTINPEPLALFIDLVVLGDGEDILSNLLERYQQVGASDTKQEILERLAQVPGVYVPAFYDITYDEEGQVTQIISRAGIPFPIRTCPIVDINRYPAYSRILTEDTEFGDMFLLQINRGCPYKCRFCHTGYTQIPVRHLSYEIAAQLVRRGLQERERIGFVGAAIADYPWLRELCDTIVSENGKLSVSSLRLSALAHADYLLEALVQAGQKTVTLAPEAGTERLRRLIRKPLADIVLYETVEYVIRHQIPNLKFYFLVGLPTETEDDLEAIIALCTRCRELMLCTAKSLGKMGKMTVSVNPFVPKPFTPLQWCPMETEPELKRKIHKLQRALQRLGNVEVIHETPKWAVWQGILARGDRKLGQVLLRTLKLQGNWKKAFQDLDLDPDFYAHRIRTLDEYFPWNHLQVGVSSQQLHHEYQHLFCSMESQ